VFKPGDHYDRRVFSGLLRSVVSVVTAFRHHRDSRRASVDARASTRRAAGTRLAL